MNALKLIIAVIGAFAPLMYFHGQAFHQGELSYWSIPADLFPLSFEHTLVRGYIAYTLMSLPKLLFVFAYMSVAVLFLYNIHEFSKIGWVRGLFAFFTQRRIEPKAGSQLTASALSIGLKSIGAVLFVIMLLVAVISIYSGAEKLGKESGENKHRIFLKNGTSVQLKLKDGASFKGFPITCSESVCAFLNNEVVQIVPRRKIEQIAWNGPDLSKSNKPKVEKIEQTP